MVMPGTKRLVPAPGWNLTVPSTVSAESAVPALALPPPGNVVVGDASGGTVTAGAATTEGAGPVGSGIPGTWPRAGSGTATRRVGSRRGPSPTVRSASIPTAANAVAVTRYAATTTSREAP